MSKSPVRLNGVWEGWGGKSRKKKLLSPSILYRDIVICFLCDSGTASARKNLLKADGKGSQKQAGS